MTQVLDPIQIHERIQKLYNNVNQVMYGKSNSISKLIMAMLVGGHVLLEDVPGLGKTLLSKIMAMSIDAEFKRIQCTPDLLPSDVTGVSIFNPETREFQFIRGPLFTNVLLVDEINRAAPRTQSCLLEAMEESQITVEGRTYRLHKPFFVIATQNPIEHHGTFELPEAQLDRFMVVLGLGYPSLQEEDSILNYYLNKDSYDVQPVLTVDEYVTLHQYIKAVRVNELVRRYIIDIVTETRNNPNVRLGVSPRGSLALLKMAQAAAVMQGRDFVIPDDVKAIALDVLSHRVIPIHRRGLLANNALISDIIDKVKVPI